MVSPTEIVILFGWKEKPEIMALTFLAGAGVGSGAGADGGLSAGWVGAGEVVFGETVAVGWVVAGAIGAEAGKLWEPDCSVVGVSPGESGAGVDLEQPAPNRIKPAATTNSEKRFERFIKAPFLPQLRPPYRHRRQLWFYARDRQYDWVGRK